MNDYPPSWLLLERLRRAGHSTRKRLGQHFLIDDAILESVADATQATPKTLVVEIGPGPATLTTLLRMRAGGIVAVERDRRMKDFHRSVFEDDDRVQFTYEDALRIDLQALAVQKARDWDLDEVVLAGNLPFQITSPLLFAQTGPDVPWRRIVVMIQNEVADRISAQPHGRDYGILTVKLAYWWRIVERIDVPASSFSPRPKVDAAVLVFERAHADDGVDPALWAGLSKFIDGAFNQRRKKLYNSPVVASYGGRDALRDALDELGLNPDARAEELSPGDFLNLFNILDGR